jgi:hypothetical protein
VLSGTLGDGTVVQDPDEALYSRMLRNAGSHELHHRRGRLLWEIKDVELTRFRCRVGHAYLPG